mgnify:CR=1 FL=1
MAGSKERGSYEKEPTCVISSNAKTLACSGTKVGKEVVTLNGKDVASHPCWGLELDPEGKSFACLTGKSVAVQFGRGGGLRGRLVQGEARVMRDGKPLGSRTFDEASHLTFDPRGRLLYAAKSGKTWSVLRDAVELATNFAEIDGLTTCADGRVVFSAQLGKRSVVSVDGKDGPELELVSGLVCAGKTFAFAGQEPGGKLRIYLNGIAQDDDYDDVSAPALSRDGAHSAYQAKRGSQQFLVVDGQERDMPRGSLSRPWLGAGGRVFSLAAQGSGHQLFVNGVPGDTLSGLRSVHPLVDWALLVIQEKSTEGDHWYGLLGRESLGPYDDLDGVHQSSDGKQIGFVARVGTTLTHVVRSE